MTLNETIFNYFYGFAHRTAFLDAMIHFVAVWYGILILVTLFVYLFEHKDSPQKGVRDLFVVGATALSAWVIAYVFKDAFHTLRPFDALSTVHPIVSESGYAFPSGHATFFMALGAALWYYHKRLAIFFGVSAVIIGLARVASGVHWPVDILGGLVLGYVVGSTLHRLFDMFTDKIVAFGKDTLSK